MSPRADEGSGAGLSRQTPNDLVGRFHPDWTYRDTPTAGSSTRAQRVRRMAGCETKAMWLVAVGCILVVIGAAAAGTPSAIRPRKVTSLRR